MDKIQEERAEDAIMFAENDYRCYQVLNGTYLPALQKKVLKGVYDKTLAVKLLEYFYTNYVRTEMAKPGSGYQGAKPLNPAERKYFATHFVDYLWEEHLKDMKKDMPKKKTSTAKKK